MNGTDPTDFEWRWRDPTHLDAHRDEFSRPVEQILEELRPLIAPLRPSPGADRTEIHADWVLERETGASGLREVAPDGSDSFWAYRKGRAIPSHLCLGAPTPTRSVCLWGRWEEGEFVIHTIYPGVAAPREIHDPEISLEELPAAIEFWRNHAIITMPGRYSDSPIP